MDIFKSDALLDHINEDTLDDNLMNTVASNLGFNYSLDRNKLEKKYDSEPVRSKTMHPTSSHLKTLGPFDLVFNSLLTKSKLAYDRNPTDPS